MDEDYTISPLGDGALLLNFANRIDDHVNARVFLLFKHLQNLSPFIYDVVPAYSSLAIYYDVVKLHTKERTAFEVMKEMLLPLLQQERQDVISVGRQIRLPVCYAKTFALDLNDLATQKGLTEEEVIRLHTERTYRVYMLGFLPGFAYMGRVDERIAAPRRSSPRTSIPAGSVGIAGEQTGIYPLDSPGGWNIIGRTPLRLFDKDKAAPVLLHPGDSVNFYSITEDEFENYQSKFA